MDDRELRLESLRIAQSQSGQAGVEEVLKSAREYYAWVTSLTESESRRRGTVRFR
jgi:hypothetical protein